MLQNQSVGRPELIDIPQFDSQLQASVGFANTFSQDAITLQKLLSQLKRAANIIIAGSTTDLVQGDNQGQLVVPEALDRRRLHRVYPIVTGTAGVTGNTEIQIRNKTTGIDLLSTKAIIATGQLEGSSGVIKRSQAKVRTNQVIVVDIDLVSTTAPKGLVLVLEFK